MSARARISSIRTRRSNTRSFSGKDEVADECCEFQGAVALERVSGAVDDHGLGTTAAQLRDVGGVDNR